VLLKELGCDYVQGYFYSKPVSATACRSLLQEIPKESPPTQTKCWCARCPSSEIWRCKLG
jgi:hypothetical protein